MNINASSSDDQGFRAPDEADIARQLERRAGEMAEGMAEDLAREKASQHIAALTKTLSESNAAQASRLAQAITEAAKRLQSLTASLELPEPEPAAAAEPARTADKSEASARRKSLQLVRGSDETE